MGVEEKKKRAEHSRPTPGVPIEDQEQCRRSTYSQTLIDASHRTSRTTCEWSDAFVAKPLSKLSSWWGGGEA